MTWKPLLRNLALVGLLAGLVFLALLLIERLGTPRADVTTADQLVQQGKDLLVANSSMVQLGDADVKFQQALALDPNHSEANAYRAVTRLLVLLNTPISGDPAVLDSLPKAMSALGISVTGRNIYNWTADFTRDASGHVVLPANAPRSAAIGQFLETYILPEIDSALANLSHVPSSFEVIIPAQIFSLHSLQQLFGYGEVAVYRSLLQALRFKILFSRSYDLDADLVDVVTKIGNGTFQFERDLKNANINFLTPVSLSKLSLAQAALKVAIDSYVEGAGIIRARSPQVADQYVIYLKETDLDREQVFRNTLVGVRNSLDGLATIELGRRLGGPADVDLNQLFSTGTNLRSMLPTFTTNNKIVQNTFLSPTFGGVFPGFTQSEWTRRLNVVVDQDFVPYDDFEAGALDSGRWASQELVREIRNGKLVMAYRAAGGPGFPLVSTTFADQPSIQSFQADVRLNAYVPPAGGQSYMMLWGRFYNDGKGGAGMTGDVGASLYLAGTSNGVDIRYNLYKCTNSTCTTTTGVLGPRTVKTAALGETHTLGIEWDGAVFTFTVDGVPTVVDPSSVLPVGRPTANFPIRQLSTQLQITGTGGWGYVAGDFDNVMVNEVLYDNFDGPPNSGPRLDLAKWADREIVREVSAGKLVSAVRAYDVPLGQSNTLSFSNPNNAAGIRADVTVTAATYDGSAPRARLTGYFYKTYSTPPTVASPGDQTGEVQAEIGIRHNGADLEVYWYVDKCTDSACNNSTRLQPGTFGAVAPESTHTLSLVWDGSIFTFGMDSATPQTFDPKDAAPVMVPVPPPSEAWKAIGTRITSNAAAGTGGSIRATFDNVYVRLNPDVQAVVPTLICGHIYAAESPTIGVAGVGVQLTRVEGTSFGERLFEAYRSLTGPDGTYCIAVPYPNAEYILSASVPGRPSLYYAVAPDTGMGDYGATRIGVVEGFTTTKDIALPLGAKISGKVTTGESTPVVGATVTLFRYNGNIFGVPSTSTTTDKDGNYAFSGLMPAEYSVSAFLSGYAIKFYNGAPDAGSADYFRLGAGESQLQVNLDLNTEYGSITGQVTNGGTPVSNATVQARGPYPRGSFVRSVSTDSGGNYTIAGLTPERYIIEVRASGLPGTFYPNVTFRDAADPISVTAGPPKSGINVAVNGSAGAISGFVLDASGNPVIGSCVGVYDVATGSYIRCASPNSDGSYKVDYLSPGAYRVSVFDTETGFINQFYDGQRTYPAGDDVTVVASATTKDINFTLAPNPGRVRGTITRSDTGAPILGAIVHIRTATNDYAGGGNSHHDGSYLVRGLAPGTYKVRVFHPDFVAKFFTLTGGVTEFSDAGFVTVTANTDTVDIDVALAPNPGKITGLVTELDGKTPIPGVSIAARLPSEPHTPAGATTRSNGTYEITGLPPGIYAVQARLPGRAVQFYNAKATQESANPVSVPAGGTASDINFALSPVFGSLSGRVTRSDGTTGVEGVDVFVFDATSGGLVFGNITNASGDFTVSQLPPGTFKVRAMALGFADRYFLAGQPGAPSLDLASAVTVTAGANTPGVNIRLTQSSAVAGTVSYTGGQVGPLVVQLFNNSGFAGSPLYTLKLSAPVAFPKAYTFLNPSPDTLGIIPGTYYARSFMDVNNNGSPDSSEPKGNYGGGIPTSIVVGEGATASSINISLVAPAAYKLSVTIAGSGGGTVTSSPAGINTCSTACEASFAANDTVTLTANPIGVDTFREWRGACTVTNGSTCQVTMNDLKSVTAVFSKTYTDSTLTIKVTSIKAAHFTELREAINNLRAHCVQCVPVAGPFAWTDPNLVAKSTPVKAAHLTELRTALVPVYRQKYGSDPTYTTDPSVVAGQTVIKADHLNELRKFVHDAE